MSQFQQVIQQIQASRQEKADHFEQVQRLKSNELAEMVRRMESIAEQQEQEKKRRQSSARRKRN